MTNNYPYSTNGYNGIPANQDYHNPYQQFNVNAPVFVPRRNNTTNYHADQHQPLQNHIHQLNQYDHTYNNTQYYDQPYQQSVMYQQDPVIDAYALFGQQNKNYQPSEPLMKQIMTCRDPQFLTETLIGCEQILSETEDDCNLWISAITNRFDGNNIGDDVKFLSIKLIVEMATSLTSEDIKSVDPQYIFATLLESLNERNDIRFLLLEVLEQFFNARASMSTQGQVNLAVFLAELYLKIFTVNGDRIGLLADSLMDLMKNILKSQQNDSYMKGLLRILKIAGPELDVTKSQELDEILTIMGGIANGCQHLKSTTKSQVQVIIERRQRGWDRAPMKKYQASNEDFECNASDNDDDLTEAQMNFLENQIDAIENDDDEEDMFNEFGKFVKEEVEGADFKNAEEMMSRLNVDENKEESENNTENKSQSDNAN